MARLSPTSALASLAALLFACISNPTPHPGGPDGYGSDTQVTEVPVPSEDAQRGVCDGLGGTWDSDDKSCVELDSGFEANAGAVDVPTGPPAADVVAVSVAGEPHAYTFTITLESDDVGCERYADWWEVVRVDATLAFRGLIAGPQVGTPRATLTGGPVDLGPDDLVVVRAHLHPDGYIGLTWVGSVSGGFTAARVAPEFAEALETAAPQPAACVP